MDNNDFGVSKAQEHLLNLMNQYVKSGMSTPPSLERDILFAQKRVDRALEAREARDEGGPHLVRTRSSDKKIK